MTRDEAVARVQAKLGFTTARSAEIITEMKNAQDDLEAQPELPWFLQTEVSSIATTSGEERVAVPSDFLREVEDDALYYFNSSATDPADVWTVLGKEDVEFLRSKDRFAGSGAPQAYALTGNYFRIFPTPDAAYTLKFIYFKKATVLDTDIENDWLKFAPKLLYGLAGREVAGSLRDAGAKAEFAEIVQKAQARLFVQTVARETTNVRYVMGGLD